MFKKTLLLSALGLITAAAVTIAAAQSTTYRNTVTGEALDLSDAQEEGRDTPAVLEFMESGRNPYNHDKEALQKGEPLFLSACSGCHGHLGEGKVGPGLNDNYWTYPKNTKDVGLFETTFGGANGMMGPQYNALTLDEMLLTMAWIRNLYDGPVKDAKWLNAEEKKNYVPYSEQLKASAESE